MRALGSRTPPVVVNPWSSSTLPSTRMRSATRAAESSARPRGITSTWRSARWLARSRAPENTASPPMRAPSSSTRPSAVNRPPSESQNRLPVTTRPVASSASWPGLLSRAPPRCTLPPMLAPRNRTSPVARSAMAWMDPEIRRRAPSRAWSWLLRSTAPASRSVPSTVASVRSTTPSL